MTRNLSEVVSPVKSITPNVGNNDTDGTGTGVDLKGYESASVVFCIGVSGDTLSGTVYMTPKVQESDSPSTNFTDVAAADLDGTLTVVDDAAEDDVVQSVDYLGSKRYIRAFVDFEGTHTTGTPIAAVVLRGHPKVAPV